MSNAKYSSTEVGNGLTGSAKVTLVTNGPVAKNYSLAVGDVSRMGLSITKRVPTRIGSDGSLASGDTVTFKYTTRIVPDHYDKSVSKPTERRGIGSVTYRSPIQNPGGTIAVYYNYSSAPADFKDAVTGEPFAGDTTRAPIKAGSYEVWVKINGTSPNIETSPTNKFVLGTYTILPPVPPSIDADTITYVKVRQNRAATLSVTASSPNGGTLSYQWWERKENGDSAKVGSNSNSFSAPTSVMGTKRYYVVVANNKADQDPAYTASSVKEVEVIEPPITLTAKNAVVILSKPSWTYDGSQQTIGGSDVVVKYLKSNEDKSVDSVTLVEDADYTLSYSGAVNVGTATLRVAGKEDYAGSLTKTFAIEKKTPEALDYTLAVDERAYTGDSLGAVVKLVAPLTNNGGAVTAYYVDGTGKKTSAPVNVGVYDVTIDVTAGANMTAGSNLFLGSFTITKGVVDKNCFSYTIPTGHRESDTAAAFGIGTVTWKKGTGYGSFTVLYNGDTTVPKVGGIYTVRVDVTGGPNFDEGTVTLGEYRIARVGDAVADAGREVPSVGANEAASVAPVKALWASFAAGPAPVSKNDVIKFFSAKAVKSGTLYIFDANGNAVAKVDAEAGIGEVGVWNLKDKNGVAAAEGAYVVRGVLIGKDGTREKVSFVFSVVR